MESILSFAVIEFGVVSGDVLILFRGVRSVVCVVYIFILGIFRVVFTRVLL